MEIEQKIRGEENLQRSANQYFEIHLDLGNAYTPGHPHAHEYYEMLYCQSNCGAEFAAGGEHYRLQRGDILLIAPHAAHGFLTYSTTGEAYAGYVLWISEDYMEHMTELIRCFKIDHSRKSRLVRTRGTVWEQIDSLFRLTLGESEMKAPGWEAALLSSSTLLLVQISRLIASDPNSGADVEKPELLTSILAYVENNLSEKITLESMANRFFVSPSTITHLFTKKMNVSFYKYVMQRRLENARNLIVEGIPMEKIALRIGFGDYSAFYRAFKQEYGVSPRQYAKQMGVKSRGEIGK